MTRTGVEIQIEARRRRRQGTYRSNLYTIRNVRAISHPQMTLVNAFGTVGIGDASISEQDRAAFIHAANLAWSGSRPVPRGGFVMQTTLSASDGPGDINLARSSNTFSGGDCRAQVEYVVNTEHGWRPEVKLCPRGNDPLAWSSTASHEFGHVLGFGDKYHGRMPHQFLPFPGHENDIMGNSRGQMQWYHIKVLGLVRRLN